VHTPCFPCTCRGVGGTKVAVAFVELDLIPLVGNLETLVLQAMELHEEGVATTARNRLRALADHGPVPMWTTRWANPALAIELGRHVRPVTAIAALGDGRVVTGTSLIGAGPEDDRILVWDLALPGADPVELGHHYVDTMVVLRDGRVVTCAWGEVLIWDPAHPSGTPIELERYDRVLAVLRDGRVAVTGGDRGDLVVQLWDPAHPGADPVELGHPEFGVSAVAVLADGRVVARVSDKLLVWDPAHPGADPVELGHHSGHGLAVLGDGRVVTGGEDRRVLAWDPAHPGAHPVELGRHEGKVTAVTVLGDGRMVTGGEDRRVLVWDPAHPRAQPERSRHHSEVTAVAVLSDGRVVTGTQPVGPDSEPPRVLVWNPDQPGADPVELGCHYVTAVAVLADGRVITAGQYIDRPVFIEGDYILVWDPDRPGADPVELGGAHGRVSKVAVLGDGRVVTGDEIGRIRVWDPAHPDAYPVELGQTFAVIALAVLRDGRVVVHSSLGPRGRLDDWPLLVFDPAQPGTTPLQIRHHRDQTWLTAVAVLPDGRVVTGGEDHRVLVWDPAEPGAAPVELGRHNAPVRTVAVLEDGRVITGGEDHRVLLWDPDTSALTAEIGCSVRALATCFSSGQCRKLHCQARNSRPRRRGTLSVVRVRLGSLEKELLSAR